MTIRVLIVDDEAFLADAIATGLARASMQTRVAYDGFEALKLIDELPPDVVVLDRDLPGVHGDVVCRHVVETQPATRVIMLTTFDDDALIHAAIAAGVHGFLLKDADPEVLADAVRTVVRGESVLASGVTGRVMQWAREGTGEPPTRAQLDGLTAREIEVLAEVGSGATNAEIAQQLYIAETTVKTHVSSLLSKLDARDRIALVLIAQRAGISSHGRS